MSSALSSARPSSDLKYGYTVINGEVAEWSKALCLGFYEAHTAVSNGASSNLVFIMFCAGYEGADIAQVLSYMP